MIEWCVMIPLGGGMAVQPTADPTTMTVEVSRDYMPVSVRHEWRPDGVPGIDSPGHILTIHWGAAGHLSGASQFIVERMRVDIVRPCTFWTQPVGHGYSIAVSIADPDPELGDHPDDDGAFRVSVIPPQGEPIHVRRWLV